MPSWTGQLKVANEEYAALNAKYLETDGAEQFIAEQQTAIALAAERKEADSEAEDEGEEEQSATVKRKRGAPKQCLDMPGRLAPSSSPSRMPTSAGRCCPGGHGSIMPFITDCDGFICNMCLQTFPARSTLYGCRNCDGGYDECPPCYTSSNNAGR